MQDVKEKSKDKSANYPTYGRGLFGKPAKLEGKRSSIEDDEDQEMGEKETGKMES